MGDTEEFVVEGAMAQCDKSKVPMVAKLSNILDNMVSKTNGKKEATTMTLGPAFGVQPFGICNMIPPTPAMPTPPCVCVIASWSGAYNKRAIMPLNSNPLTTNSKGTCVLGGSISFKTSGQMAKVDVVNVDSLSSSNICPIGENAIDNNVEFRIPEDVDLSKSQELLSHLPNISKDINILYKAYLIINLFDVLKKDDDHIYKKKKDKLKRDDQFDYQNEIEEFFGEYAYAGVKDDRTTEEKFNTLLEFEIACISKNLKVENIGTILGELEVGTNTQIGAEWVLRDLAHSVESNSAIKFEHVVRANNDEQRRIDVVCTNDDGEGLYVEYKSVKKIPPGDFVKQFGNDLNNQEYDSQHLKWRFDGDKLSKQYKKSNPDAWEGDKSWKELSDDEKELVRSDFRDKMRFEEGGVKQSKIDVDKKIQLLSDDDEFDEIFIIA